MIDTVVFIGGEPLKVPAHACLPNPFSTRTGPNAQNLASMLSLQHDICYTGYPLGEVGVELGCILIPLYALPN